MSENQFSSDPWSSEGIWERLSNVAVKGAEYDSPERQPHPKCLKGTREDLLRYTYGLLDNGEKSRIIWVQGTAGVGKSAIAFTVAETMKSLKVSEQTPFEKRLAGSFFFSRKHTKRCTTGYFFATLAYQLASNFPSVRGDVNNAIRQNPALLDPDKSLRDQMEALFLQPLRRLRFRLCDCQPPVFVVDALDECTSRPELADLISLLGQALCAPDMPVIHIFLTSRSEAHIQESIREEGIYSLVCEIPVKTSGEGVAKLISLDGVDVDNDICIFLEQSFIKLRRRCSNFPQPTRDELARLATRAGRRFIVASTMMKFIDDGYNDPRDRLQLMLNLTSDLLPGTEVYKLYNGILSTCADPGRAYLHLSVVAALADPLPISQISELLGPGEGRDVETALVQLRSLVDIPTDGSLPVNIYHSSVRDYVSDPSNCSLPQLQYIMSPHSLLARSSLRLMIQDMPASVALLDALSKLKGPIHGIQPDDPMRLKFSLSFLVQPLEPLRILVYLIWLRGGHSLDLQFWLDGLDGHSWLQTREAQEWLGTKCAEGWLKTPLGKKVRCQWVYRLRRRRRTLDHAREEAFVCHTCGCRFGVEYNLKCHANIHTLVSTAKRIQVGSKPQRLRTPDEQPLLQSFGLVWHKWVQIRGRRVWVKTLDKPARLLAPYEREVPEGREWLNIRGEQDWLHTTKGREWLHTQGGHDWLQTRGGHDWLQTRSGQEWLWTQSGREWVQTQGGREWVQTSGWQVCLQTQSGQMWLHTLRGQLWLQTLSGQLWLQTQIGQEWLQTESGHVWLQTEGGQGWLHAQSGQMWLQTQSGQRWLHIQSQQVWVQSSLADGRKWRQWLETLLGRKWLQTQGGREWLHTPAAEEWLRIQGGREWLRTQGGQEWLQTSRGQAWLFTWDGRDWLQTQVGQTWLETIDMQHWLRSRPGWLQSPGGQDWLRTPSGRDWVQTPDGQAWQLTPAASIWMAMEDFSSTLEAIDVYTTIHELPSLPAFQVIQYFKSLPDFLMFPAFLAFIYRDDPISTFAHDRVLPDIDIIHSMTVFTSFANEAQDRSRSSSDALKYACQNFAVHLSLAPKPWDDILHRTFKSFWNHHLVSWLERQWCLKGLRSCVDILSEGQKLAKEYLQGPESS